MATVGAALDDSSSHARWCETDRGLGAIADATAARDWAHGAKVQRPEPHARTGALTRGAEPLGGKRILKRPSRHHHSGATTTSPGGNTSGAPLPREHAVRPRIGCSATRTPPRGRDGARVLRVWP